MKVKYGIFAEGGGGGAVGTVNREMERYIRT